MTPLLLLALATPSLAHDGTTDEVSARLSTIEARLDMLLEVLQKHDAAQRADHSQLASAVSAVQDEAVGLDRDLASLHMDMDKQFSVVHDTLAYVRRDGEAALDQVVLARTDVATVLDVLAFVDAEMAGIGAESVATSRAVRELGARLDSVDAALAQTATASAVDMVQATVDAAWSGETLRAVTGSYDFATYGSVQVTVRCDSPFEVTNMYASWSDPGLIHYHSLAATHAVSEAGGSTRGLFLATDVGRTFDYGSIAMSAGNGVGYTAVWEDAGSNVGNFVFMVRTTSDAACWVTTQGGN
ncbi:MAG: hypothetical protein EP330_13960 [Deltaproteobacteria bacterium]|nr:MAG: hypothetical protein EP330_13960 [Deltaproteobacteria bacterium]